MDVRAIVLAAGKGTRLHSREHNQPKALREALGKPLLGYVLDALRFLPKQDTVLVVGYMREQVEAAFPDYPFAVQEPQNGTGHAVQCAAPCLADFDGTVLVCCGDMPLLRQETYQALLEEHEKSGNVCTFLTGTSDLALPFGRIVRNADGEFLRVVEEKDCTPEEKEIAELNVGVYAFNCRELLACLSLLQNNNAQGEYYLTDVPELLRMRGGKIGLCCRALGSQILGVNTPEQLSMVEEILQNQRSVGSD